MILLGEVFRDYTFSFYKRIINHLLFSNKLKGIQMNKILLVFFSTLLLTSVALSQNTAGYWHLDEISGNYVEDVSGYGNDGTADTSAHIVQGFLGNARMVPQYTSTIGVTVPNSTSLNINGNNPFTLEAFVKLDNYEANGLAFIHKLGNYGLELGSFGSAGYLQLFIWPNTSNPFVLQSDEQLPLNQWIHIAGTWDGSVAKLYVNHQLVKSQNYSDPMSGSTEPLWLASTGLSLQPTTETIIDEVRITAAALLPEQFITEVRDYEYYAPANFVLEQNYPNPFNPSTTIRIQLQELNFVSLKIYDVLGNEITTLLNEEKQAGIYAIEFNAKGLSSGIYFYSLCVGSTIQTKKMILLK